MVAKELYLIKTLQLALETLCPSTCIDVMIHSYHNMPVWIDIGIGISIGKNFSSVLGIKNIGNK